MLLFTIIQEQQLNPKSKHMGKRKNQSSMSNRPLWHPGITHNMNQSSVKGEQLMGFILDSCWNMIQYLIILSLKITYLINSLLGKVTWNGNGSLVLSLVTGKLFLFFSESGIRWWILRMFNYSEMKSNLSYISLGNVFNISEFQYPHL